MIRVSALYANRAGARFDHAYYALRHIALVREQLTPHGLLRVEADRGLAGGGGGEAPFVAAAHLYFASVERFEAAFAAAGAAVLADVPNYTDLQPQLQISTIVVEA
ncbi:EthD family reductase [Solimonas flava]|uniref:EthD family reductase n=1 Tax=Solimonas flava TaxID=415849 RepID=UPI0004205BF5|nr:EthD family reductase [Solimonas flava]